MKVYTVWHVHEFDAGGEDVKFLGVYSTKEKAEEALKRLREQPGFRDTAAEFEVHEYELDKDHWIEGYITVE